MVFGTICIRLRLLHFSHVLTKIISRTPAKTFSVIRKNEKTFKRRKNDEKENKCFRALQLVIQFVIKLVFLIGESCKMFQSELNCSEEKI